MKDEFNSICITKVRATICSVLGFESDSDAEKPIEEISEKYSGKCDRVFVYNPDAIAMWIYEKYPEKFKDIDAIADFKLKMLSVYPPVTPVCFGSMYSGLLPEKHGITHYEKPVLKVNTVFDDIVRANKKAAIISTDGDSISMIFKERKIDYYICETIDECNSKAYELIDRNEYDLIVLYNGNYDFNMHKHSPEGKEAMDALDENISEYLKLRKMITEKWKDNKTALVFAPDHGCHEIEGSLGTHGINEPCDMNIMHFWSIV